MGVRAAPTITIGSFSIESSSNSLRLVEQLAADQHAPDLRSSGADLVELRVAPQPSGRIVVDVAVAAKALNRVAGDAGRVLAREQDRAGGILARRLALVARLRDRVDVRARGIERR